MSKEMLSKAAVLVVVSFLLVILIYSSVVKFDAFAKRRVPVTATSCVAVKPDKPGAVYAERCCDTTTYFNELGLPAFSTTNCQVCQWSGGGTLIDCSTVVKTGNTGGLNPPPSAGAVQPPGNNNTATPPPGSVIKVPTTNAFPAAGSNNNTGPVNGTTIKVPPGLFKPTGNVTNTLPPSGNNTGNTIAMTSSDNPPGCSKKVPIPPNCTLNPFNNSASNKAQPQQTQTRQTTGQHHHHKGSNTGTSTSSGNSTGH